MGKETEIDVANTSKLTRREELDKDDTAIEILDEKDITEASSDGQADSTEAISDEALPIDEIPDDNEIKVEAISDEDLEKDEATADNEASEKEIQPQRDQKNETSAENDDTDFIGLDDTEVDDQALELTKPLLEVDQEENLRSGESGSISAENIKNKDQNESAKNEKISKLTEKSLKVEKTAKGLSRPKKIFSLVLLTLIITGIVIYAKPLLVGGKKESKPTAPNTSEKAKLAPQVQDKADTPKPLGKLDLYAAKLEDTARLIDELLVKKEEIAKLKLYYQNRNAELADKIIKEMQKTGITFYSQAADNKVIELSLRTIQRRQTYIRELEKPALWVHHGIEELLYLKRKAQVDLEMIDVAGGLDLEGHMRRINTAILKYQLSAENLKVQPLGEEKQPLKTVWRQIKSRQEKVGYTSPKSTNDGILKEICGGNFTRIAELTSISTRAAQCLSKLNGADLFLNGLTKISHAEARYLFQWHGNWICLNGIKELTPAVAKYLFEWEGNWISLNGLTEFPPELASYLMKWNGKQLELMGLKYNSKNADQKALKYLALWETTGGKLFVSDTVRKEMERVMM